jgi:hypothetical protein
LNENPQPFYLPRKSALIDIYCIKREIILDGGSTTGTGVISALEPATAASVAVAGTSASATPLLPTATS